MNREESQEKQNIAGPVHKIQHIFFLAVYFARGSIELKRTLRASCGKLASENEIHRLITYIILHHYIIHHSFF